MKNTNDFTHSNDATLQSSTEYSINGERSLKIIKSGEGNTYARITYNESVIQKTITLTGTIKNSGQCSITLFEFDSSIISQEAIIIPANSDTDFSLTLETGSQNASIILQFLGYNDFFIDNLKLIIQ